MPTVVALRSRLPFLAKRCLRRAVVLAFVVIVGIGFTVDAALSHSFAIGPFAIGPCAIGSFTSAGRVPQESEPTTNPIQNAASENRGQWIWDDANAVNQSTSAPRCFRITIPHTDAIERAVITINCDNRYQLFVGGRLVGQGDQWQTRDRYEITSLLKAEPEPGQSPSSGLVVAVMAESDGESPAGLLIDFFVAGADGQRRDFSSGQAAWKVSTMADAACLQPGFDDSDWQAAVTLGPPESTAPWSGALEMSNIQQKQVLTPRRPAQTEFSLLPSDRLTLLGGAWIERLQYDARLEARLYAAHSTEEFQVRNLGWSGDDVTGVARAVFGSVQDGWKRRQDDTLRTEPTVVLIAYGSNESFAGPSGLDAFAQDLTRLLGWVDAVGATAVLVTPPPFQTLPPPLANMDAANENLNLYCQRIRQIAQSMGLKLIDLHALLQTPANPNQAPANPHQAPANPHPTGANLDAALTENGVHLSYSGTGLVSDLLARELLGPSFLNSDPASDPSSDPASDQQSDGTGHERAKELLALIRRKNELYFHRYRPQNETYLFLFRKHEQGNNAAEVPVFDTLVRQTEQQIRTLCRKR